MNREKLVSLYEQSNSLSDLSRQLNIPRSTLYYKFKRLNIPIKSAGYKSPRTVEIPKGEEHYNWKGGKYVTDGYALIYQPCHPKSKTRKGYIPEHRLVVEKHLGRYLTDDEIVHHINKDTQDNRIENLEILDRSEHIKLHKKEAHRDEKGKFMS